MTPSESAGAFTVERAGLFTTIQDLGRPGHARLGISAAGAADPIALRLANRLAGNPENAAALEMTLTGGVFRFEADAVVALAGADMQAQIRADAGTLPVETLSAAFVPAFARLECGPARSGARAVLAVRGGIREGVWLGSASTHAGSRLGGQDGRALVQGDRLTFGAGASGASRSPVSAAAAVPRLLRRLEFELRSSSDAPLTTGAPLTAGVANPIPPVVLRVTAGAQWTGFDPGARAVFTEAEYTVSGASDRMGLRLEGAPVPPPGDGRMPTEGMPLGAVQIPPAGRPVILFVDHQTTGGYPVIAAVVSADLPQLGQLRPGARVRFRVIDLTAARALLLEQEARLAAARPVPA